MLSLTSTLRPSVIDLNDMEHRFSVTHPTEVCTRQLLRTIPNSSPILRFGTMIPLSSRLDQLHKQHYRHARGNARGLPRTPGFLLHPGPSTHQPQILAPRHIGIQKHEHPTISSVSRRRRLQSETVFLQSHKTL